MLASVANSIANRVPFVKKSVVIVLVLVAAVVLVSPALVGRLAERSMDENLNWAAAESGAVNVTSEQFDRGWFSSEGQHRIALREGDMLSLLEMLAGPMKTDELPVLIIHTRLDHGLFPVASMSREQGSLSPGLGSAVSTLQLETPDGEAVELPGTIFSKVTLGGELESKYVLEAGSRSDDGVKADWSDILINVATHPQSGKLSYDGAIDSLLLRNGDETLTLRELRFRGEQQPTPFGIGVGSVDVDLGSLSVDTVMGAANRLDLLSVKARSSLDGDRLDATSDVHVGLTGIPEFGDMLVDMSLRLDGADARALGNIQRASKNAAASADPTALYEAMQADLKQVFAAGFEFSLDRFEATLPQGKIVSTMNFLFAESDAATFGWASLLLGTEAAFDVSIPVALVEAVGQDNAQVAAAIAGGFLVRKGDVYEMQALLKKGLLTVNGAPFPLPLGTN